MKYSISDAAEIAKSRNGQCLSKKYKNTRTPLKWKCLFHNHIWNDNFYNIKNGHWCKKCSDDRRRYNLQKCISAAKKYKGFCLEDKYINSKHKMLWQCKAGHKWKAQFCEIVRGSWCRKCRKYVSKYSLKDAQKIAKKRAGKCLSKQYSKGANKLKWLCINKHIWYASIYHINKGSWCPRCKNKSQQKLFEIIKQIYCNHELYNNFRGFDWLKTKKYGKQEIDIFIRNKYKTFSLGVEYDGAQHFIPVSFGGISAEKAKDNLKKQKYLDRLKNKKIKSNKKDIMYFIRFSYKDKITLKKVKEKLIKNKIPIPNK